MVRPIRRIVAGNDDTGKAVVLSDGPSPDVLTDPARPGFASTRLWVTDCSPARVRGIRETLRGPQRLAPPLGGTQCRFIEYPPEDGYIGKLGPADVRAWFERAGSPEAHVADNGAPHPYLQRTRTLDLCYVLEGELVLVLDSENVALKQGDVAILNGASHAWSNRSAAPAILILSQHSGIDEKALPPPIATDRANEAPVPSEVREKFRRVVVGHDAQGRSRVIADGGTPNVFRRPSGSWFYEMWTIDDMPAPLLGNIDRGCAGRTVMHSPPAAGANWRLAFSPADDGPVQVSSDARAAALDSSGGTERRPGGSMHRTPSVDYAICVEGERTLVLEDSAVVLKKGDVVIQLGNWHTWANHSPAPSMMSYVMIGGEFG